MDQLKNSISIVSLNFINLLCWNSPLYVFWTLPILYINELAGPAVSTLQVSAVRSTERREKLRNF